MRLGVLAVVATLGGLFVLSKTEKMASENVVFHAKPWKKKRISDRPTILPLWAKINRNITFNPWNSYFVNVMGWRWYKNAQKLGLKPKWGIIDPATGLLSRSIQYASFDSQSVSIYNLLNPFMLNKLFEEWGISDKRIADIDISYRGPNHTSTLDYLVRVKQKDSSHQYAAFNSIYEKVKDKIILPPRFTKKSMKQFVESFGGSTKQITLLNALEQGKIEDSIDLPKEGGGGDWYWLRWAQKNLYEMDEKDVLKIIFEIAAVPETAYLLNGRIGKFANCVSWMDKQKQALDPQYEGEDNYRAPHKTITQLSLITQMLSAMALIEQLPVEATVLQLNNRGSWDVYVKDPYMQRYDEKIQLNSNRDIWDISIINEIWESISTKVDNEMILNARMSKKAGGRQGLLIINQEIDKLEKILDGGVDDAFRTDNPYRYLYEHIKVRMPERPNYDWNNNNFKDYAQRFPMVATKTRMDKLKQQGIDEIDKCMQEALDKIPEIEDIIKNKAQQAKDEWDKLF